MPPALHSTDEKLFEQFSYRPSSIPTTLHYTGLFLYVYAIFIMSRYFSSTASSFIRWLGFPKDSLTGGFKEAVEFYSENGARKVKTCPIS